MDTIIQTNNQKEERHFLPILKNGASMPSYKMKNTFSLLSSLLLISAFSVVQAQHVVVTTSNDSSSNELLVYDANGSLLQSVPTNGQGGVAGGVGGAVAKGDSMVAVINHDSQNVSVFKQEGSTFTLSQVIRSHSKPVSVAFGPGHLYILGEMTVESHLISSGSVSMDADGTANLLRADGSSGQVGVLSNQLIISEKSNTIELVDLKSGVVTTSIHEVQLPAPPQNETPLGLTTKDDVAYITIAHSFEVGLVKDGEIKQLVSSKDQLDPCWLTVTGSFLYCSNPPSKTVSLYTVTDSDIVLTKEIAAPIQTGGSPFDLDAQNGVLAVLDVTDSGSAHISQFQVDAAGNLQLLNTANIASAASGIAVIEF